MHATEMVDSLTCLTGQDASNRIYLKTICKISKYPPLISYFFLGLLKQLFRAVSLKLQSRVFFYSTYLCVAWNFQLAKFLFHSMDNNKDTFFEVCYVCSAHFVIQ